MCFYIVQWTSIDFYFCTMTVIYINYQALITNVEKVTFCVIITQQPTDLPTKKENKSELYGCF